MRLAAPQPQPDPHFSADPERVRRSFELLMNWTIESRRLIEARLNDVVSLFEARDRVNKEQLAIIADQTKKTNGGLIDATARLDKLEHADELRAAFDEGHERFETEHDAGERIAAEAAEKRRDRRHTTILTVSVCFLGVIAGTIIPELLHHLGA